MKYNFAILSALLLLVFCILTTVPALAVADPFEPMHATLGPDGNVYALVSGNGSTYDSIFVFAPDGRLLRTINGHADMITFDASGNLYACDARSGNIRKMDINGQITETYNYRAKSDIAIVSLAAGQDGKLYIGELYIKSQYNTTAPEFNGSRISVLCPNGTEQLVYQENNPALQTGVGALAIDASGTIYTLNSANTLKVISPDGTEKILGRPGSENGTFLMITGISLGGDGYLYVTEYGNHRVQKLTTNGTFVEKWNGAGFDAFLYPYSTAADASGKVYVADPHNERIVWVTPQYAFGDNVAENLKGQGTAWGNVYQGTNYTTRLHEITTENQATATPGFMPLTALGGFVLTGLVLCVVRVRARR